VIIKDLFAHLSIIHIHMIMRLIVYFLLLIGVYACHTPLQGTYWQFKSYGNVDNPTAVVSKDVMPERKPHVRFTQTDGQGRIGASAGCNSMGGVYELTGNDIKVDSLISTLMACDQLLMRQEDTLASALQAANRFEIKGKRLLIFYQENQALEFVAQNNEEKRD